MSEAEGFRATNLYLIRHGHAVSNVEPFIAGRRGCKGLTEKGRAQAARLRDRLRAGAFPADALYASPLCRARETAEFAAEGLDLPVQWDEGLEEWRFGDEADGLSLEEFERRFTYVDPFTAPLTPAAPGGESWAAFMLRAATALERIARENEGRSVAVVTHGGVVGASFVHFLGMNGFAVPPADFATENTGVTHWARRRREGRPRWTLVTFNDAAHLRD